MISPELISRAKLDDAVERAPEHLRPIYAAVRDCGVSFGMVTQNAGRFAFPSDKPVITILGDDLYEALGPAAFHRKSVRRFVASCGAAVVISCEAQPRLYVAAASAAVCMRCNVVIVETRNEREADWIDLVRAIKPDVHLLVGTVRPPTAARH